MPSTHRFSVISVLLLAGSGFVAAAITHSLVDIPSDSTTATDARKVTEQTASKEPNTPDADNEPGAKSASDRSGIKSARQEKTNSDSSSEDEALAESAEVERLANVSGEKTERTEQAVTQSSSADGRKNNRSVESQREQIIDRHLSVANDLMGFSEE